MQIIRYVYFQIIWLLNLLFKKVCYFPEIFEIERLFNFSKISLI